MTVKLLKMLRNDADPELRAFDPQIRFLHWLTLFLVTAAFVLAFSIDLAASKDGAVVITQLHRSFGVTLWVVTVVRVILAPILALPQLAL